MKNMNNFAAQQLTKKQMNNVKGGQSVSGCAGMAYNVECTVTDSGGINRRLYGCAAENGTAVMNLAREANKIGAAVHSSNCIFF